MKTSPMQFLKQETCKHWPQLSSKETILNVLERHVYQTFIHPRYPLIMASYSKTYKSWFRSTASVQWSFWSHCNFIIASNWKGGEKYGATASRWNKINNNIYGDYWFSSANILYYRYKYKSKSKKDTLYEFTDLYFKVNVDVFFWRSNIRICNADNIGKRLLQCETFHRSKTQLKISTNSINICLSLKLSWLTFWNTCSWYDANNFAKTYSTLCVLIITSQGNRV